MIRLSYLMAIVVAASAIAYCNEQTTDLAGIDRTIHAEPAYQTEPHYALLVFGPRAEHRAWFVLEGDDVAYIDRNCNGDLTEPGERIEFDNLSSIPRTGDFVRNEGATEVGCGTREVAQRQVFVEKQRAFIVTNCVSTAFV